MHRGPQHPDAERRRARRRRSVAARGLGGLCGVILAGTAGGPVAAASSVEQRVGAYSDNQGLTRQRVAYDIGIDGPAERAALTSSSFDVTLRRDSFNRTELKTDEYDKEVYGGGYRLSDAASVGATQTLDRLSEIRELAAYSSDGHVKTRTWSTGLSQWTAHETVRLSFDLSRTIVDQPRFEVLDFDSRDVGNPTVATATGATIGLRQLATPTTIVDYTAGHVLSDNRPASSTGGVAVRQFLPPLDGAVHVGATRAYNRGYVATDSTYGQVDSWTLDTAYLQTVWQGGLARLGYRFYKEDETTRAYQDEKVFGSDTLTVGMTQELPKGAIDGLPGPLRIEAAYARYLTNVRVAASSFELGVAAKL